jgi:thymidylate synthase (FAD)
MRVQLISVSQPRIEGLSSAEDLVAYCARISNPTNQFADGTKLVQYLIRNKHWSPLEMVHLTVGIWTTRDIARQILRHRSLAFQEFSQRYAQVAEFSEPRKARLQDLKNRQNSIETNDADLQLYWDAVQRDLMDEAQEAYAWAINNGIAKEQARVVLPEGLTTSSLYASGSLRSWIHYCQLRMDSSTQKEHREIAQECWKIICKEFPSISGVFDDGE